MLAKSAEMWCLLDLPIEDAYKKLGYVLSISFQTVAELVVGDSGHL